MSPNAEQPESELIKIAFHLIRKFLFFDSNDWQNEIILNIPLTQIVLEGKRCVRQIL